MHFHIADTFNFGVAISSLLLAACSTMTTGTINPVSSVSPVQPASQLSGGGMAAAPTGAGTAAQPASQSAAGAKTAEIPRCKKPIDSVALVEPTDGALATMGLTSPLTILRMMITQSNCFSIVDRGPAMGAIAAEQKIAGNSGKGKLVTARYFITPQIVFQNQATTPIGSALSPLMSFLPVNEVSTAMGTVAGNVNHTMTQAQTVLFLTDGNTGTQVAAVNGSATTSEIGFMNAGLGNILGAGTAYATTDAGKTAAAAMLDAYGNLVSQFSAKQASAQ